MFDKIAAWFGSVGEASRARATSQLDHLPANPTDARVALPRIAVPYALQADESAVVAVPAKWYRITARGRSFASAGGSFSLGRGFRVHAASGASEPLLVPQLMSEGTLVATSRRFMFVGSARSTSIGLDEILQLTFGPDAMHFVKKEADTDVFLIDERIMADERFHGIIDRIWRNDELVASAAAQHIAAIKARLADRARGINEEGKTTTEYRRLFDEGQALIGELRQAGCEEADVDTEVLLLRAALVCQVTTIYRAGRIDAAEADRHWLAAGQPTPVFAAAAAAATLADVETRLAAALATSIEKHGLLGAMQVYAAASLPDEPRQILDRAVRAALLAGDGKAADTFPAMQWLATEVAAADAIAGFGGEWVQGQSLASSVRAFFREAKTSEEVFSDMIGNERAIVDKCCFSVADIHAARKIIAEQVLGGAPAW